MLFLNTQTYWSSEYLDIKGIFEAFELVGEFDHLLHVPVQGFLQRGMFMVSNHFTLIDSTKKDITVIIVWLSII